MLGLTPRSPYVPVFAPRGTRARARAAGLAGDDVVDALRELPSKPTVADVDRVFRRFLRAGDVPRYISKDWWAPLTIHDNGHTLELLVAPDYWAAGTNADPFRAGNTSETFAQEVADQYDAILPSQKLERLIEAAASPKIPYMPIQKGGGEDASIDGLIKANDLAEAAMNKRGVGPTDGKILVGYRKAYVVRPGLDGKYIAIYGGRWSESGGLVQPPSGHAHTELVYSGPSHGIVLVSRKARLDGDPVDLRFDVFGSKDPGVYGLVSDEGRFDPVFPNAGSKSVAQFSVTGTAPKGAAVRVPGTRPANTNAAWWALGIAGLAAGAAYAAVA